MPPFFHDEADTGGPDWVGLEVLTPASDGLKQLNGDPFVPNAPEFLALQPVIAAGENDRAVSPRETAVAEAVSPALAELAVRLEDVVLKEGAPPTLVILVDSAETAAGSLNIDQVADASRAVSEALDASDVMGSEPYDLEVSTPGLSRPLTHLHHFQRNVGRLLTVKRRGAGVVEGRLLEVHEDGITLQSELPAKKGVKPKLADPERIPFSDINKAKVDVEFSSLDLDAEGEEA